MMWEKSDHTSSGDVQDSTVKQSLATCNPPHLDILRAHLSDLGLELDSEGIVRWERSNKLHPRNWSLSRKLYDISLIVILDFATTAISSAGAATSDVAREDLKIGRVLSLFSFTSIYMIGQGFGGAIFPPFSESFGRKKLYVISTALYSLFCLLPGVLPYLPVILIGRFGAGVLSAIPTNVVAGSIEDMFNAGHRIWMIFAWLMAANLGLSLGPIYGAFVVEYLGWHWHFRISAIFTGAMSILLLFTRESRPSQLLEARVALLRKATGDDSFRINNPDHAPDLDTLIRLVLLRPIRLLFTEPIVFVTSIISAVAFALVYLFTEAIPIVYGSFGFSATQSSLVFLAMCVGICLSVLTRFYDQHIFRKRQKNRQPLQPEDKLTGFAIGAPLLAIGLWWFAWTVPPIVNHVPWIVSSCSLALIGYACTEFDTTLAGYVADSYTIYAASAFASMALARAVLCAVFPLFAHQMFVVLGSNKALTVLASLATLFCLTPILLLSYGTAIRKSSKFASYSLDVYRDNQVDAETWEIETVEVEVDGVILSSEPPRTT
ncbi:hypothetical protein HYFRA_00013953 [Hymenoscyphus fraxineus]|uniref:Major facilitator superfamily (MFS) profile domain-containing protein n=1 Tax=Hymenoscyphus fraxineus TaxID=746836 RepID=A0A9N9PZK8_9HELO|nr:hypothetical protein HYFRA_00013953 [Hymenoscyphus fraxineus]